MKECLAIFDLDGTLFDTGEVNYYAYKAALEPFGVDLDKNYFTTVCNGRHYSEFLPDVMDDAATEDMETVHNAKKTAYKENLDKARENVHLFKMIESLADKYYIAIVTTASRKNTLDILKFFGRDTLFEFMVTQENIKKTKPDPEGFLIAMDNFGIDPAHTLIFEDSEVGIKAAEASGATVFAVKKF